MRLGNKVYLFLGAEGMSELPQGSDWLREVSGDESHAIQREADPWPLGRGDVRFTLSELWADKTGRPYWLVEVTDKAPRAVRERAASLIRSVRL